MRPPVWAPSALIVVRPPKNQRCSPSPGPRAMGAVAAASVEVMAASLLRPRPVHHPPRGGILLAREARGTLSPMAGTVEQLAGEIDVLATRGLPREEFFAELSARVRRVVDNDASCWHTMDPTTRLLTSDAPQELIERGVFSADEALAAGELIVRSEYMVEDVNTFAGLAGRRVPVG